ncbi:hypothetical protein PUN28_015836 [Cardiocondyla obscurior]|uniref:Uncharacterized protein n=1 Tax=Cardiocondyla obscurior TaxID=286306 RepID=A0AAW2ERM0_9HYME
MQYGTSLGRGIVQVYLYNKKVSILKFKSDIQIGLLKFNQSCGRFFSRNIISRFSKSYILTLFSFPPHANNPLSYVKIILLVIF